MKKTTNHIEEYLINSDNNSNLISKEIFKADSENIDLKTELIFKEVNLINRMVFNDSFLKSKGLRPVFKIFYHNYMRLKVSLDRKSRGEFVNINKSKDADDVINSLSSLNNITGAKK